ncbi:hypothetical protein [uncultured Tateyamaria sp.]|uniref:hypothetical protein n=1 Tax=uncultured Tateyamaria sp. TaxID=455651 RepID=UPI00261B062A|nr:hypothetical protein [uncultured Tateyamaria sp.]
MGHPLPGRILTACLAVLVIAGCAPGTTVATTRITLNDGYVVRTTEAALIRRVEARARQYGGTCTRLDDPKFFLKCRYRQSPIGGEIEVLRTSAGAFIVAVGSSATVAGPGSQDDVLAGAYVSDVHKDFEAWMLATTPGSAVVRAVRRYGELGLLNLVTGELEVTAR